MLCGDILDQLLDQYGLTYTGTTEQTDLTTLGIRSQKVDNLDTCLQDLNNRTLLFKGRRISVDDPFFTICDLFFFIDRFTKSIGRI